MKVLIVDDNGANRLILRRMVMKFGAEATCAVNGREAVEAIRRDRFDLIFMDLSMPVMDGFEAAAEIRKLLADRAPPVYAVSANVVDAVIDRVVEPDFSGFIAKPVDLGEIREKLADA